VGSGQGSVSTRDIVTELDALVTAVSGDAFSIQAHAIPLSNVQAVWNKPTHTTDRLVLIP
ncbi:MAG: NADPH:quinone reductase, partial [Glaciihabitans sp.]|nr:NADPH:quinone reductase [Glaciihabitans sp.]